MAANNEGDEDRRINTPVLHRGLLVTVLAVIEVIDDDEEDNTLLLSSSIVYIYILSSSCSILPFCGELEQKNTKTTNCVEWLTRLDALFD